MTTGRGLSPFQTLLVRLLLLFVTIGFAWVLVVRSQQINEGYIWFTNVDQDSDLLVESLRVNAGREPEFVEHPGLGVYIVYGAGFRILKSLGYVEVATIDEYFGLSDPILALRGLYEGLRHISLTLCVLIALISGVTVWIASGSALATTLATNLVLGASGFLLQSLMARTELTTVFFVALSSMLVALTCRTLPTSAVSVVGVLGAGLSLGLAMFSKMVALPLIAPGILVLGGWWGWHALRGTFKGRSHSSAWALWIFHGVLVGIVFWFFFGRIPAEAIVETKLRLILYALGGLWLVQGFLAWQRQPMLFRGVGIPLVFLLGVLGSTLIAFTLCNVEHLWATKHTLNTVFSTGMARSATNSYAGSLAGGPEVLAQQVIMFLSVAFWTSGLLPLAIVALLVSSWWGRAAGTVIIVSGLGMYVVMSMRYFAVQYLIFGDFFFVLAIGLCFGLAAGFYTWFMKFFRSDFAAQLALVTLIALGGFGFSLRQYLYIGQIYQSYNSSLRDRIFYVSTAVQGNGEYLGRMKERYGSVQEMMTRVLIDPRLNGADAGIDLGSNENVRQDLANYQNQPKSEDGG